MTLDLKHRCVYVYSLLTVTTTLFAITVCFRYKKITLESAESAVQTKDDIVVQQVIITCLETRTDHPAWVELFIEYSSNKSMSKGFMGSAVR